MAKNEMKISQQKMTELATHIEEYLNLFLDVFIIPDNLRDREDEIYDSIKTVKKLIRKLRKGDTSVFTDIDELE